MVQLIRVDLWDPRKLSFEHPLVEAVHVFGPKRWYQSTYLIYDTAQRPDIALAIIGEILPNLWRSIVGRSRLCIEHSLLRHLGHIEITELGHLMDLLVLSIKNINVLRWIIVVQKHIGAFQISMKNVHHMQLLEASHY